MIISIKKKILFFSDMTTAQIEAENTQMTNDLYRLLKKYSGLRNLIRQLKVCFLIYNLSPQYSMYKLISFYYFHMASRMNCD